MFASNMNFQRMVEAFIAQFLEERAQEASGVEQLVRAGVSGDDLFCTAGLHGLSVD